MQHLGMSPADPLAVLVELVYHCWGITTLERFVTEWQQAAEQRVMTELVAELPPEVEDDLLKPLDVSEAYGRRRVSRLERHRGSSLQLYTVHKRVRARVEQAFADMKAWNILPAFRRRCLHRDI